MTYRELLEHMKTGAGRRVAREYVAIFGPDEQADDAYIRLAILAEEKAVEGIPEEAPAA